MVNSSPKQESEEVEIEKASKRNYRKEEKEILYLVL
jgi:hypothetical protein